MLHPSPRPPREGGDPERGQPDIGVPQVWAPAFAGDADEGDFKPLSPASLRGASRRSKLGEYHIKSAPTPWIASLRSQ
jgi:hypothetical protein